MVAEDFAPLREAAKMHRAEAQKLNSELLPALLVDSEAAGLRLEIKSEHHWNLYRGEECLAQFWPTKNKFQNTRTGKLIYGTGRDMLNYVIKRL